MNLISMQEAAKIKKCRVSTIWQAINRKELNQVRKGVSRTKLGKSTRVFVVDDAIFKSWKKGKQGGDELIILKSKCKELGWNYKNPISGYIILDNCGVFNTKPVTHARCLPLDI